MRLPGEGQQRGEEVLVNLLAAKPSSAGAAICVASMLLVGTVDASLSSMLLAYSTRR